MKAAALPGHACMERRLLLRERIGAARRRWIAARGVEAALLAVAAACSTLAAGILSGGTPRDVSIRVVALVAGACCAAAWLAERWRSPAALARRLDVVLDRRGALVTAFESESRASPGPLERALVARVLAELTPDRLRAALPSPSVAFVAVPLFAAAALVFVLEQGFGPRTPPEARALARTLSVQLARLAGDSASSVERARALSEVAALAARVGSESEGGAPLEEARRALREVELRSSALAEDASRDRDPLALELARARELSTAALRALESRSGQGPIASRGSADDTLAPTVGDPASGGARAEASGSSSAGGPASGAPSVSNAPSSPEAGTAAVAEAGTLAGRWWPGRYDGLVAAWTEARRRALERNP